MASIKLSGGYRLPADMTFADVQRFHEELFASEGLDLLSAFGAEESDEDERDPEPKRT
jgi:hypothetical protein